MKLRSSGGPIARAFLGMLGICLSLAACRKSEEDRGVPDDPLHWQAPKSVGGLTLVSSTPGDMEVFRGLSAADLSPGASVEHAYTSSSPEEMKATLLIVRHSPDRWQAHDFDGIWHRLIRERPKATLSLHTRVGQRVLSWSGAIPRSAVSGGLAWRSSAGITVLIQSTSAPEDGHWLLADQVLKAFPSQLPDGYQVKQAHDFVVQEVEKCIELARQESLRQEACLRLSGLTFFIPEGMAPETQDIAPLFFEQFPRWWDGAKKHGQEHWLKERLARETAKLLATSRQDYPYSASSVALSLEKLAGTRFPPAMLQGPEDLSILKSHWEGFTRSIQSLPRPRWASEEIEFWIRWLESPSARTRRPTEITSSMLTLKRVLDSLSAPAALLELPRINASRDTRQYFEDLDRYLGGLKTWWKERRPTATASPSHVPPLFEEGGNPRVVRE